MGPAKECLGCVLFLLIIMLARLKLAATNPLATAAGAFGPAGALPYFAIAPPAPLGPFDAYGGVAPQFFMAAAPVPLTLAASLYNNQQQHLLQQPEAPSSSSPSSSPGNNESGSTRRRSHIFGGRSSAKESSGGRGEPSDEQKALGDLPLSFIDDPPSSITERLSDSFSALGEGVKNHFRSISENFSDTMDEIKDAWRPSDSSRKRRGLWRGGAKQ